MPSFRKVGHTLGHPRPYLCFDYIDRHGSAITAIPLKHHTDYKFELYNREETIVWGRKDELHSPVNDEDLQTYASHRENEKPGIFVCVFYNIKRLFNPFVENTSFFKGFITTQKCEPNCNLQQMVIPAGEYAKIYQNYPNGEMDWAMPHYIVSQFKRESKRLIDNTRPCIVEQRIDKNGFEFHIPIINK